MEKEYIKIGAILSARGLFGEAKVYPTTDFIDQRYVVGEKVYLFDLKSIYTKVTIESVVSFKGILHVKFKEINLLNDIAKYLKHEILINKKDAVLPDGYVFDNELINLNVKLTDGTTIGVVSEVINWTAQKSIRIKRENKTDVVLPLIDEFVVETDLEKKEIIITPLEGML